MAAKTLFAVAVLLASAACAVASTDGKTIEGYKFGSDAQKYVDFAKDACDISDLVSSTSPNLNQAESIYTSGNPKNGKRTGYTQSLQVFATYQFTGEKYWSLYGKFFNDSTWLDSFMTEAFKKTGDFTGVSADVQSEGIQKTATSSILVQLVLHELDTIGNDMTQGKYGDKDGAPHTFDEAFATYAGNPTCGPWANANKYAPLFGTIKDCKTNASLVNNEIAQQFIAGRAAAKKKDRAGVQDAINNIISAITASHIQAVLKYTYEIDNGLASGQDVSGAHAEAYTFYRTIAPLIAEANSDAANAIYKLLDLPNKPVKGGNYYNKVKTSFEATYAKLGINPSLIGAYGTQSSTNSCPKSNSAVTVSSALAVAGAVVGAVAMLL
jgi:hypothetical protein